MKGKMIVSFVCLIALCVSLAGLAVANDTVNPLEIDTPYEYPILPGTPEWFSIENHAEKVELCQIPEDILNRLTTAALVESVVNYPYFDNMSALSTAELGYAAIRDSFNGLQELERRPDGASKLLAYYQTLKSQRADGIFLVSVAIEITLHQPTMKAQLTPQEQEVSAAENQSMGVLFPRECSAN